MWYFGRRNFFRNTKILLRNRNFNFYEVLGVERDSTNEEIKAAYLKLAKQFHPDVNKSENSEEKFKTISLAYEALSNQRNRDLYDSYMYADPYSQDGDYDFFRKDQNEENNFKHEKAKWDKSHEHFKSNKESEFWSKAGKKQNAEDFESDFFKEFDNIFSSGYKSKQQKGEDMLLEIKISFEDSLSGCNKAVQISKRRELCTSCKGTRSMPGFRPSKCFSCGGTGETKSNIMGVSKCKMCKGQGILIKNPCK